MNDIIATNNLKNVPAMFSASGHVTKHWRLDMNILTPNNPCIKCGGIVRYEKSGKCVNCKSNRAKVYRENNAAKVAESKRLYRILNIDKVREGWKKWTEANKEKKAESDRRWAKANPDKVKANHKRWRSQPDNAARVAENNRVWRQENPDKAKAYGSMWLQENREISVANTQRRRARLKGSGGSYTAQEWIDLCNKYGNKCLCCGRSDIVLTVDHVKPLIKGGSGEIGNIQPLCKSCNSRKGTKTIDYR